MQATVLAKEGIELLYNVRDSNLEKNLSWNCVMNPAVYGWTTDDLNGYYWDSDNPEWIICSWKFWINQLLKLSFDKNNYLYQELLNKSDSFEDLFKNAQLCLFSWDDNMYWYAYCSDNSNWEETIFARYISFSPVYYGTDFSTDSEPLSTGKILKVDVHVLYDKLGKTWDIVFESFIWNY